MLHTSTPEQNDRHIRAYVACTLKASYWYHMAEYFADRVRFYGDDNSLGKTFLRKQLRAERAAKWYDRKAVQVMSGHSHDDHYTAAQIYARLYVSWASENFTTPYFRTLLSAVS